MKLNCHEKCLIITLFIISGGFTEIYVGDRYSACKPGPKLAICYTGLVHPPSKVWCEQVTGHSALIVWNKGRPKCVDENIISFIKTNKNMYAPDGIMW